MIDLYLTILLSACFVNLMEVVVHHRPLSVIAQSTTGFLLELINRKQLTLTFCLVCSCLSSHEMLTIRQYLDLHEDCLRLFGFTDPWKAQKQLENDFAIARLSDRLQEIDKLEADERWTEICRGMLAGESTLHS